ncbi:MAG: cupin-like domain-containing protein [Deltaproteobacteria bacterium]|nr:cupin-like domain-containing protein [Deltaproteobacteria bacterium]
MEPRAAFWRTLLTDAHLRRPHVFRRPFGAPIATAEETFRWLCAAADALRAGSRASRFRMFASGDDLGDFDHDLAPRASDGDTTGWLDRVEAHHADAGLVVNDLQAAGAGPWSRILPFLSELYARTGMPPGGAALDLFCGRYRRGLFGLHKDDQDVFTFVVEGRKRFLVWPFEALADAEGVTERTRLEPKILAGGIDATLRAQAIVLEGEPGDVLYWPAEWWHCAEAVEGEPRVATTLALGLFRDVDPSKLVSDVARAARRDGVRAPVLPTARWSGDARGDAERSWDAMLVWLARPEVREKAVELLMGWGTAFGFLATPQPIAPAEDEEPREALPRGATLVPTASGAVAWSETAGGEVVWSVGGEVFRYPPMPGLARLLARIAMGEPLTVAQAVALVTHRRAGHEPEVERDVALHVIDELVRHHALRVVHQNGLFGTPVDRAPPPLLPPPC